MHEKLYFTRFYCFFILVCCCDEPGNGSTFESGRTRQIGGKRDMLQCDGVLLGAVQDELGWAYFD